MNYSKTVNVLPIKRQEGHNINQYNQRDNMAITNKNKNKDFKKKRIHHSRHIERQRLWQETKERFNDNLQ